MAGLIPSAIYVMCFMMSAVCALMLGRSYRSTGVALLLWSAIGFVLFAGGNLLLVIDLLVVRDVDLQIPRALMNLAAISVLLFGFVWNGED